MNILASTKQSGFSLVELIIVVTMLGILYASSIPLITNFRSIQAKAVIENVNVLADQWSLIYRDLGVSPNPSSTALLKSGYNILDLLVYANINNFAVSNAYVSKWSRLGAKPLMHTGSIEVQTAPTASNPGSYLLSDLRIGFTSPTGANKYEITLYGAAEELVENIFSNYSDQTFTGTSQSVTGLRYSQTGSTYTVNFGYQ